MRTQNGLIPFVSKSRQAIILLWCDAHFFDYFAWLPRKMVRIGIIGALSDTHFCILSRDCFNLSREYFSLWVIKTSLDRNASAVLERKCYFHASLVI